MNRLPPLRNGLPMVVRAWLAFLCIGVAPVAAMQPQPITTPALRELLAHDPGDILVQFTSSDPNCGPCVQSNAGLPGLLDQGGWTGRFLRVTWTPWPNLPPDLNTLPGVGKRGAVPFVVLFRGGQAIDGVEGQNPTGTAALLQRAGSHGAAADGSTAVARPPAASTAAQTAAASTPPAGTAPLPAGNAPSGAVATLSLSPDRIQHLYGQILQVQPIALDAARKPLHGVAGLVWSSSDPATASVDNTGRVRLLKRGKATITARAGSLSAQSEVEVLGFSALAPTQSNRACALPDSRDAIYCWGKNLWTIPLGPTAAVADVGAPTAIARGELPEGTRIRSVVIGIFASCALTQAQQVYCWGNPQRGAPLGREMPPGTAVNTALPPAAIAQGEVPAGIRFSAIGVGPSTACAAGTDQHLYCWGDSRSLPQQATRRLPATVPSPVAIPLGELPGSASVQEIALSTNGGCVLADGEIYCWAGNGLPKRIPPGEHPANGRFTHVDSDDLVCALGDDGGAYCSGSAAGARFGGGTAPFQQSLPWRAALRTGSAGFARLSKGGIAGATCALDAAGQAWCWGKNHMGSGATGRTADVDILAPQLGQRGEIPADVKLVNISCGQYHCTALGDDGRLYAWGSNEGLVLGRSSAGLSGSGVPIVVAAPNP